MDGKLKNHFLAGPRSSHVFECGALPKLLKVWFRLEVLAKSPKGTSKCPQKNATSTMVHPFRGHTFFFLFKLYIYIYIWTPKKNNFSLGGSLNKTDSYVDILFLFLMFFFGGGSFKQHTYIYIYPLNIRQGHLRQSGTRRCVKARSFGKPWRWSMSSWPGGSRTRPAKTEHRKRG